MRRSRLSSFVCLWAATTIVTGGCPAPAPIVNNPVAVTAPPAIATAIVPASTNARPSIEIDPHASSGSLTVQFPDAKSAAGAAATITTLAAAETQALLARLEPLPVLDNSKAPAMRPPSAAPARSGTLTPIAFAAPTGTAIADKPVSAKPAVPPSLLAPEILPTGEIGRAESELHIRFDEPMVPVAAVGEMATPLATISPPVAGTWRWIDTRVAGFFTRGTRFQQATEYTVTVPAGTRAVSGATLATAVTGTFSTPPVTIEEIYPRGAVRSDAPLAVIFDQEIDRDAIVKSLHVETGDKHRQLAFKPITLDAAKPLWARNPHFELDDKRLGQHYVILAPAASSWPAGIDGQIVLHVGAPSKEGPRLTTKVRAGSFSIAPEFKVEGITCTYGSERARINGAVCPIRSYVELRFSNTIEPHSYRSSKVQIDREDAIKVEDNKPLGAEVPLAVPSVIGRTYGVTIGDGIVDELGQPLVGPHHASFTTTREHFDPYMDAARGLYILDPRFQIPQWVVGTQAVGSLRVQLFKVQPSDYFAFEEFEAGKRATPPGKRVYDKTETVGARYQATDRVDLRPALDAGGTGHIIALATTEHSSLARTDSSAVASIEVTRLGLVARVDGEQASAWVQSIAPDHFLAPLAGATASLLVPGRSDLPAPVTTDASGHAAFELAPYVEAKPAKPNEPERTALLVVKSGADSAFQTIGRYEKTVRSHNAYWYVTDDRFTYKPGEKVYVKGWIRWSHNGVDPDLTLPAKGDTVAYAMQDAQGNKLVSGTAQLTPQGGFDLEATIPETARLGTAVISFLTRNQSYSHPIKIEEFRAPAYSVTLNDDVTHSGATPLVLGETIEMNAEAKYYAGGGLAGAKIRWNARLQNTSYQPPGWDLYSFTPVRARSERRYHTRGSTDAEQSSVLSGASSSSVVFGIAALPIHEPSVLTVDATVTDVDRATIRASSRPILVHPSAYYVGLRQTPLSNSELQVVVTDIDGNAVPNVPIDVTIEGVLGSENDRDDAKIIDTQHCKLTSGTAPVPCAWKPGDPQSSYRAIARIADARGRDNAAEYWIPWWQTEDRKRDLDIVPDHPSYRPGQVAKLQLHSAILPATAVVSFDRQGIIAQKRVEMTTELTSVELPIEVGYIQNIHVVVDRWAKRRRHDPTSPLPLPEHMSTEIDLPVDVESARLVMKTRPLKAIVQPGDDATFEVEVKHDDKPVAGAEVALIVVDEAILSLSDKTHPDPLAPFYRQVRDGTSALSTLGLVRDSDDELKYAPGFSRINLDDPMYTGTGSGYGYGAGRGAMGHMSASPSVTMGSANSATVKARKDFRATAVFSPTLETDAQGKVRLTVKMPDSLTRFRIVALATATTHYFGKAESTIVTQRKINARTVAPRFLTQGDRFSLPVVVQNLDGKPRTIDVAVRAANLVTSGPAGKRVTVGAGQRAEVRFELATQARGRAVIQTIASSNDFADAMNVELPVYEPATTESFATYGIVDDKPVFEQLAVPSEIFADVGGIETEVASTQLQSLTDAYWYLYAYPYECSEQRSSRMLATTAMYDLLDAFAVPGRPSRKELEQQRYADYQKLAADQNADGGWGYWADTKTDPFVTMQVLTALVAQRESGTTVNRATAYVAKQTTTLLAKLEAMAKQPVTDRKDVAQQPYWVSLAAAGMTALAAAHVDQVTNAQRLHVAALKLEAYPIDAKARLLALVAKLERTKPMRAKLLADLLSATHETAASATVAAKYVESERLLLVSDHKTTALALDAIMREAPEHALVTKLARGLLDARRYGRWMSTQENLAVLTAMRHYFDIYEKDTPNYTGKLWIGTAAYAEQAFVGRSNARGVSRLDWSVLAPGTSHDVTLQKTGPGRMYYRIGITYAPKQADLPPLDAGFIVRRTYRAVDDASDVVQTKDGHWKIKLGAKVQVELEAVNSANRDNVALVDPLPAGFEAVNTHLAIAERAAADSTSAEWDHVDMRDNRSEAFASSLRAGSHWFSYTVRATTPGTFLAAPTKAEEMYSPETFGRSSGTTVVIE